MSSLTDEQVSAITHAWLDLCAASDMSEVDLEGLQDAAKNSTEELEEAFTKKWWNGLEKKEYISYENGFEKIQKSNTMISNDDHLRMLTLERVMHGYNVVVFEAFIPMIQMEATDTADIQWTIIKN